MAELEKFDAAAAAAGLPDYPAAAFSQGARIAEFLIGETRLRMVSDGAMTLPFRALCLMPR